MRKLLFILLALQVPFITFSQDEFIAPLQQNMLLYHQTKAFQNKAKHIVADSNIVFLAQSLPFTDDFSSNSLMPYTLGNINIVNTFLYATGSCITASQFETENIGFSTSPAYFYFYNLGTSNVDSTALPPVDVHTFSSVNCFPTPSVTTSYWPSYYRSVLSDFDALTGEKLDSTLVPPNIAFEVAKIYIAHLPQGVHWLDHFAWWNTTNPVEPITIGVATLDGLNEFGLPYNNTVTNAYGEADVLTSSPIDLSTLSADSNVYLSFFYQAGGNGDFPNPEDSLIVEFRGLDGEWVRKWSTQGNTETAFKQVYIPIYQNAFDSLIYSNSSFQFRFKNYASLSGNNDLWNIDYVRLDKNRLPNTLDTVIRDVSLLYDFPSYFENYSQITWMQMEAGADQFNDTIRIPIRDNGQVEGLNAGLFPLQVNISNTINADVIYSDVGSNFNPELGQEIKALEILPSTDFTLPVFTGNTDSFYFENELIISPANRNSLLSNDTIQNAVLFHNVLAYDDGSAERSYGVSGGGNEVKKFAYEFEIAVPDTLAAVQFHFSNTDENVSDLVFSIYVWDSLEIGVPEVDNTVHIIGTIENKKPNYVDEKNGFYTFVFDTPILVYNKFYVGWAQIDNRNLQIGYDVHSTKGKKHMYVFSGNSWNLSTLNLEGSPMLRAVLDGDYPIPNPTAIANIAKTIQTIKVYPNPASSQLTIDVPKEISAFHVKIVDFTGKIVYQAANEQQIDVSKYSKGMYALQIIDTQKNKAYASQFIVK